MNQDAAGERDIKMALREEIRDYRDADKLVAYYKCDPTKSNASGNGVLYTSLYYLTLQRRGELTDEDCTEFRKIMDRCQTEYAGLYKRGPYHPDQNAMDDYIGLTTASRLIWEEISKDVLIYGQSTGWVYNNVQPAQFTFTSWFGRMPQVIAHFHWAAGETPPLWMQMYWSLALFYSSFAKKEDQDAWLMSWLMIQSRYGGLGKPMGWAARKWWLKYDENFPGIGAPGLVARCLDPGHPLGRYFIL